MTDEQKSVREGLGLPYLRFLPLEALGAAAAAFEYGSAKYVARNWELSGLPWQQMIDSLRRHLDDFERGKDIDESGLHQVCMIMASAMMLCASVVRQIGVDDRQPITNGMAAKDVAYWIQAQLKKSDIDKYLKRDISD